MNNIQLLAQQTCVLLHRIISEVVLEKSKLGVRASIEESSINVIISCVETDYGRIIGGKGSHVKSLKALLNCIAIKQECSIDIASFPKATGRMERYNDFRGLEVWRHDEILLLLRDVVSAAVVYPESVKIERRDEPNFTTRFIVRLASGEEPGMVRSMILGMLVPGMASETGWLKVIFNAVGKANGRTIFVEVVADQEFDPQQPQESSGRYAPELER